MSTEKKVDVQSVITMLMNKAECESDAETGRDGVFLPLQIEEFIKITRDMGAAVAELIEAANEVTGAFRAIGNDRTTITPPALVRRAEKAMKRLDAANTRVGGAS